MAEPVGLTLGIASIVLQLYTKVKNSSTDFHHLDRDLKSFLQTLILTEDYLNYLDDIRLSCEELVADIERLLSNHASRNPLRRVQVAFEDIQPLRVRLILQISALNISVSMLKGEGVDPFLHCTTQSTKSSQSLSSIETTDDDIAEDSVFQRTISDLPYETLRTIVSGSPKSSTSTLDTTSSMLSLLSNTGFHVYEKMGQGRLSIQSSKDNVFPDCAQAEFSTKFAHWASRHDKNKEWTSEIPSELWSTRTPIIQSRINEGPTNTLAMEDSQSVCFEYTDTVFLRTPLIWAIIAGKMDIAEQLLDKNACTETRDGVWNWTPAIWAIMEDKPNVLGLLIQRGANLEARDNALDRTPLLWAASIGNEVCVQLLLESKGIFVNTSDRQGMTPLVLAYLEGHVETARLLVEFGADPDVRSESGSSLLAWAILAKDEAFALLLLEHGAHAQSTDMDNVPVLILAIQQNLPDVSQRLVAKGADLQCTDRHNVPALTVAVKSELADITKMLIDHNAGLEAKDGDGNTALHWALWRKNELLVRILLDANADPAALDGEGVTAQQWAEWTEDEKIVQLLSPDG